MPDLKTEFDEAMMNVYRRAKDECGYNATDFLKMLHRDKSGVTTAKRLLASAGAQHGFTRL